MKKNRPDISILIVSWNTRDLIEQCLDSVEEHLNNTVTHEIIIVDNASEDGTAECVRARQGNIQLIENKENAGFANAVNQAAQRATGRYFLLLNSDTRFMEKGLSELVQLMDDDATIGIATGALSTPRADRVMPCFGFPKLSDLVKSYTLDRVYRIGKGPIGKVRFTSRDKSGLTYSEADWISGSYMLVRRELMTGDLLLDSRIFMYFEDTLLCLRAWEQGYRVAAFDTACVYHFIGASARQIPDTTTCHSYRSSRIYVDAVRGPRILWWYESVNRAVWTLFIPCFFALEHLGFSDSARAKRRLFHSLLSIPRLT